jgi:hypothetical protein
VRGEWSRRDALARGLLNPRTMARSEAKGDLVDVLVYLLWIAVLVMILQRA